MSEIQKAPNALIPRCPTKVGRNEESLQNKGQEVKEQAEVWGEEGRTKHWLMVSNKRRPKLPTKLRKS
ncbi:ADM_HP2_G0043630.mRNA.1.CDS.1 [Saccharomyces cerevisiae]|nr:ADM_HP2_G0043630.mRNA.1.CDS.1 [Saccharomyces cerevisiae]CAI6747145.1 ADM_HP2_G0043630.mRNA.1.CDS.1 [Saccharomyces cerevisiae]